MDRGITMLVLAGLACLLLYAAVCGLGGGEAGWLWRSGEEIAVGFRTHVIDVDRFREAPCTTHATLEETFWGERDRPKAVGRWHKETAVDGNDLEGYAPFPRALGRQHCRLLCDSIAGCAAAAWGCEGSCRLKGGGSGRLPRTWAAEHCVHSYVKDPAGQEPPPLGQELRAGVSRLFAPLLPKAEVVVAVLRCEQNLTWLVPMARRVGEQLRLRVQIVVYERCVEPAQQWVTVAGLLLFRQSVHDTFSPTLALAAHLVVNLPSYLTGAFKYSVFVDADLECKDARLAMAPARWDRWDLPEFGENLVQVAQPVASGWGVHLVKTTGSGSVLLQLQAKLVRFGDGLLTWDPPDYWQGSGSRDCRLEPQGRHAPMAAGNRTARSAIVTYISDATFLTSARVLIHSLEKVGCQSEVVIAMVASSMASAGELLAEFPHAKVVRWPYIDAPYASMAHKRWKDNYSKLNLFNMVQYDVVLYIDADVVALQDPGALFAHPAVRAARLPFLGTPDWGTWQRPPSAKLNGGVLLLRPSRALFRCLLATLYGTPPADWRSTEAEQGFLRYFFGDRSTQIPFTFNAQKTIEWALPEIWDPDRIVLLHYVGVKPHRTWSPAAYLRTYRGPELREALRASDQVDDESPAYADSAKHWRRLFFELAGFSKRMSLFAAYNDSASLALLGERMEHGFDPQLLVPVAVDQPSAPSGAGLALSPELQRSVPGRQLGGLAVLLAVAAAPWYRKPWIGFTTSEEGQLATRREGVSVDWVKAERWVRGSGERREVLFWYGLFAGDYWELMDLQLPGLREKMQRTLGKLGLDVGGLPMPRDRFWPFGNYLIMPLWLLREYAGFATGFIRHFQRDYADKCRVAEGSPHGRGPCIFFALERLLHIWAVVKGVSLEFIVDDPELRYSAGCRSDPARCRRGP